jgi:hypothetical protein
MIHFYTPWDNLGCLGVQIGYRFYADIFVKPYIGIFLYLFIGDKVIRKYIKIH